MDEAAHSTAKTRPSMDDVAAAAYYAIAPQLVSKINHLRQAARIWTKTYWLGIFPAALAAKLNLYSLALRIYKSTTDKLESYAS